MKKSRIVCRLALVLAVGLAAAFAPLAKSSPFASSITNNNGTIQFYINEGGGSVIVVYEDGTTNANFNGVTTGTNVASGLHSFALNGHTGYSIICTKIGNGTPFRISSDSNPWCQWPLASNGGGPRGVDANKNPKIGYLFGRVYIGYSGFSASRQWGIYALTPDLSTNALGRGTNAETTGVWAADQAAGNTAGPWKMTVAPDNSLYVADFGTPGGTVWQFGPSFEFTNLVLWPIGENEGYAAGTHGDSMGVFVTGSTATGDLEVYTADPDLGAPATAQLGDNTAAGDFNNLFRYDIGSGPLPWSNAPDFAVSLGLQGFQDSQILDLTVETNTGYLIGMIRRLNLSNGNIQVFDKNGHLLYTSLHDGGDIFAAAGGAWAGVRISPDGRFLATMSADNQIEICNLTNGIPDESTFFTIPNLPSTALGRGIAWDAADNLYECSSGQGLLRYYSLGISTTTIASNDVTGTNGSFELLLPSVTASVTATANASQNYVNNTPAGTPIPGVFTINLNTNNLAKPVAVAYTLSGSATYLQNYTLNLGTNANGIIFTPTNVVFPAGAAPGGNWSAGLQIIPTATPLSGPTLNVGIRLAGGANYFTGTPYTGSLDIFNTGPQLLVLSAAPASTMNRSVPNDYAEFFITRYGDLNGPGNSAGSVTPTTYTITNFTYRGTAAYPADYSARAQNYNGSAPIDGSPGITIQPGQVIITNIVGNPVAHANLNQAPTNVTIVLSLTNAVTGTNATSQEGLPYSVSPNAVTLTEIDNTVGPEVVLWSDSLNSAGDSTNWTLTFASTGLSDHTVLPVVVRSYTNGETSVVNGGTNDFDVQFGWPVADDGVSPSPYMAANGLTNALRMTVNKNLGAIAGVNLYAQGMDFHGNYALRFSMYLSLQASARDNPYAGTYPWEFAAFGINHDGTNCNWRASAPITSGCGTTNADGIWFAIDAGIGSLTPADYDAFTSPALPNRGVTADLVSNTGQSQRGVFKHPPFDAMTSTGGEPVDQWVDVSVEVTYATNVSIYINRAPVLSTFDIHNGGDYTNGTIMLGYLDPNANVSDNSAFVDYSDVRVVELSPYILSNPADLIATQGENVAFTASAGYATAPMTNVWYLGDTNPAIPVATNVADTTNFTGTLTLNNVQIGTNYTAVFSDPAGSITGQVARLEVVQGPANVITNAGSTVKFQVAATGQMPPTGYQWKLNGNMLTNVSGHIIGATASTLYIVRAQAADEGTYSVVVTNAAGSVTPSAFLSFGTVASQPSFSSVSVAGTNVVLSFSTPDAFATSGSFIVLSSPVVTGPYTTNTQAVITGANGTFQITVPETTNGSMFYRLQAAY